MSLETTEDCSNKNHLGVKCPQQSVFKRSKPKEFSRRESVDALMSCFDRDHRVVVQRHTSSGAIVSSKNGRTSIAQPAQPSGLESTGRDGVAPIPSTAPRTSRTVQTNAAIKLKNLKERMQEDVISADQKLELEIEYADCLCNLGRFREASLIYARIFAGQPGGIKLPFDRLKHFIRVLTKITVESVANAGVSLSKFESERSEDCNKMLLYLPGQTCPDPLSCPVCAGVLCDPISLPCGHTFCRKCIAKTSPLQKSCLKCGAPWRPSDCLAPSDHQILESEVIGHLKTNVLIGRLVQRYWSDDLKAVELKAEANALQQKGLHQKAVEIYTQALQLAPTDYFLLGNRSLTYHTMGYPDLALADAIKATEVKPDWAKGFFRKAMALQALGRHEEAFQAFYECLTLEEDKSAKQVKQELAKELHSMLSPSDKRPAGSEESSSESSFSSSSMETDDSSRVIPLSMVALVEYACEVACQGVNQSASSLPNWMTRGVTPYRMNSRPIKPTISVDSQDFDCPLCMQIMVAPVTTPCGHTFCRRCLDRSLDHSPVCPLCKSTTLKTYLAERREAINEFLEECMRKLIPEEFTERERTVAAELMELAGLSSLPTEPSRQFCGNFEEANGCSEIPIFVCTISFPNVRCPLHIFEPRYRLMIRRTMEIGTRQFGMTCKITHKEPYSEFGTMLEIRDIHVLRDGRSVIDTRGRRRFRVLERRVRDGYNVASVEFLKDAPVPSDQLAELIQVHNETMDKTREWFNSMTEEMRRRFENHYGDMPSLENEYWELANGPSWHWWTIAILPLDPQAQVQVLSQTSLKKRLETIQRIIKYLQTKNI